MLSGSVLGVLRLPFRVLIDNVDWNVLLEALWNLSFAFDLVSWSDSEDEVVLLLCQLFDSIYATVLQA